MKFAQSVRVGIQLLIGLNLLMALGAIWVFTRMSPAIKVIIDRNERSLESCEIMLATLAASNKEDPAKSAQVFVFEDAFIKVKSNITEIDEPAALDSIEANYAAAFLGNSLKRDRTVRAIQELGRINREAMIKADQRAQQFGYAGAWGIAVMAVSVFLAGMIFIRQLTLNLIRPVEEIDSVITSHLQGDTIRRCSGIGLPKDIRRLYGNLNELLDRCNITVRRR